MSKRSAERRNGAPSKNPKPDSSAQSTSVLPHFVLADEELRVRVSDLFGKLKIHLETIEDDINDINDITHTAMCAMDMDSESSNDDSTEPTQLLNDINIDDDSSWKSNYKYVASGLQKYCDDLCDDDKPSSLLIELKAPSESEENMFDQYCLWRNTYCDSRVSIAEDASNALQIIKKILALLE